MVDHQALVKAFRDYSRILLEPYEIGDVLYLVTDQLVDVMGVAGSAVSVAEEGDLRFVAATDADLATVEARQAAASEGPCHDAFRTGAVVVVEDLADEERWQDYTPVALEQGCRAVCGIPMLAAEREIGALNLYHRKPHAWTDEELELAEILANMASSYILNLDVLSESRTVVDQLQRALDSRVVIEQAKGVLAGKRGISTEEAFELLRAHARSTSTKLHDVCRRVVAGVNGPAWPQERRDGTS